VCEFLMTCHFISLQKKKKMSCVDSEIVSTILKVNPIIQLIALNTRDS
jgi:hypothetical protein